jgi:hypothetical protein
MVTLSIYPRIGHFFKVLILILAPHFPHRIRIGLFEVSRMASIDPMYTRSAPHFGQYTMMLVST